MAISNWWAHRTTDSTKRLTVIGIEHWPLGEYRHCRVDSNYTTLDCSGIELPSGEIFGSASTDNAPFTIDVRFSGDKTNQHWTCQNGSSLVCKNSPDSAQKQGSSDISTGLVPVSNLERFLRANISATVPAPPTGHKLDPPLPGYIYVRASDGQLWEIPADKLKGARRIDPGLHQVDN